MAICLTVSTEPQGHLILGIFAERRGLGDFDEPADVVGVDELFGAQHVVDTRNSSGGSLWNPAAFLFGPDFVVKFIGGG
jgi:hypothetical protein